MPVLAAPAVTHRGGITLSHLSLVLLIAFGSGLLFLQLKLALRELPFLTVAAFRLSLAAITLSVVSRALGRTQDRSGGSLLPLALIGAVGVGAPMCLQALGTGYIDSAMAALVFATMPTFATVLAAMRGVGAPVYLRYMIPSLLIGLLAVAILVLPEVSADATDTLIGGPLILLAAFAIAIGGVESRVRFPGAEPLAISSAQMLPAALLVLPFGIVSLALDPPHALTWDLLVAVLSVALLGTLQSGLMFVAFMHLVMTAGPAAATYNSFIAPLIAVSLGALVLGEHLDWRIGVSLALIVVCLALLLKAQRTQKSLEVIT